MLPLELKSLKFGVKLPCCEHGKKKDDRINYVTIHLIVKEPLKQSSVLPCRFIHVINK